MLYRVENIVRKGEIACYKQFFFLTMFSTALVRQNVALYGNGLSFCMFLINQQLFKVQTTGILPYCKQMRTRDSLWFT